MNEGKLNNRQFVMIALLIVLCGIAIIGHDYFMAKRANAYEKMSIMLSQEPEYVEDVSNSNNSSSSGDTSGRVKKKNVTYKGKQYSYSLVKKYKDRQGDGVTLYRHSAKEQLTLITCSRPDYQTYYLVLVFELTNEKEI